MKRIGSIPELGISSADRVLIVMPHPDDEAVFAGGLMCLLNRAGIATRLLTVTRGEASTHRYGLTPSASLGDRREQEVIGAARILGTTDVTVGTVPDGGIPAHTAKVTALLKTGYTSFKPTVIVTLEPDGVYGHPDHIALSAAVTRTKPPTARLLYATVSPRFIPSPSAARMAQKAVIKPLTAAYELVLSPATVMKKLQALRSHRTQFRIGPLHWMTVIFFYLNRLLTREYFTFRQ